MSVSSAPGMCLTEPPSTLPDGTWACFWGQCEPGTVLPLWQQGLGHSAVEAQRGRLSGHDHSTAGYVYILVAEGELEMIPSCEYQILVVVSCGSGLYLDLFTISYFSPEEPRQMEQGKTQQNFSWPMDYMPCSA